MLLYSWLLPVPLSNLHAVESAKKPAFHKMEVQLHRCTVSSTRELNVDGKENTTRDISIGICMYVLSTRDCCKV